MSLRQRLQKNSQDPTTKKLVNQGVYRVDVHDNELGHFHRSAPYSFFSGMKYIMVLSLLLWWLPTVGQMIAGYVGGRRTGVAWKAVIAALLPLAIIFAFGYAVDHGYLGGLADTVTSLPATIVNSISNGVPALTPYAEFVLDYLTAFVMALRTTFSMGTNGYLVTIIFAYIGGLMAEQARRESTFLRRSNVGISFTQPTTQVNDGGETTRFRRRQPISYASMKKIPVAYVTSEKEEHKHRPEHHHYKEKVSTAPKSEIKNNPKEKPVKSRDHKEEVKVQRFVQKALGRYETGHR